METRHLVITGSISDKQQQVLAGCFQGVTKKTFPKIGKSVLSTIPELPNLPTLPYLKSVIFFLINYDSSAVDLAFGSFSSRSIF